MAATKATPQWAWNDLVRATAPARAAYKWILAETAEYGTWGGSSYRPMGPNEYPIDHPSGNAIDIMTPDATASDAVTSRFIAAHKAGRLKVAKLIARARQWKPTKGWYNYTPGGHYDHVHIRLATNSPIIEGDDMPITQADANLLWGQSMDGETMRDMIYYARHRSQTAADKCTSLEKRLTAVETKLTPGGIDTNQLTQIVRDAVAAAIADIDVTIRSEISHA